MMHFAALLLALAAAAAATDEFLYHGFASSNLSLNGIAEVMPNGLLQLTNDTKESLGHAFHPSPVAFTNASSGTPASFSTTFVFAIVPEYPMAYGHGLALALSPTRNLPGTVVGKYLGLFNMTDNGSAGSRLVAVELDTAMDPEFSDINDNHVGIDVLSLISKNSAPAAYVEDATGEVINLTLVRQQPTQVWVEYNGTSMHLQVTMAPAGVPKPSVPLVQHDVNLSSVLSVLAYVGFSGSNGAATSQHYILGWSFSLNGQAPDIDLSLLPEVPEQRKGSSSLALPVASATAAVLALAAATASLVLFVRWHQRFAEVEEDWEKEYGPQRIRYKDLYKATQGFSDGCVIGRGGFGKVYRGSLPRIGTDVAIKKISHDSRQGMQEFVSEIASMSMLRNRNLVQLLGYCRRQGELMLVYEYMPNGSLDKLLFDNGDDRPGLSWAQRFKIIHGVAAGLLYLHEGCEQLVVHRDIKASNVLLDADMNARLGDFGLARLYDREGNPQTTRVVGTFGYLAPELTKTGKATASSDVFAFGVFVLEVLCGQRPVEVQGGGSGRNVTWLADLVLEYWKAERVTELRDPRMADLESSEEKVVQVMKLGLLCTQPDPDARPTMRQVVQFLNGLAQPLLEGLADGLGASTSLQLQVSGSSYDEIEMSSYPATPEMPGAGDPPASPPHGR